MTKQGENFDAIVLGAGAAGLMCALTAGQRGRKVVVLEHTDKAGAKILISGGGRCNFTNLEVQPRRFISSNEHFCTSALKRYSQEDFVALVRRHGIGFHEKTLGQLFCDGSARQIVKMLLDECAAGQAEIRLGQKIASVTRSETFIVETDSASYTAPALVLASGGLSIPKMGATGLSYEIAKQFGLRVTETKPGLVPLKAGSESAILDPALAGVSLPADVSLGKHSFRENILFTHRGLSGPAILQISSYWSPGTTIALDIFPEMDAGQLLIAQKKARPKAMPQTVLSDFIPSRLAHALTTSYLPAVEMANVPDRLLVQFGNRMKHWDISPAATEGFAKAEVTVGGIDTRDLSSKTMEARVCPGLYAIGEAVDVTGWLGGYNFQWAWSSGRVAGQAI